MRKSWQQRLKHSLEATPDGVCWQHGVETMKKVLFVIMHLEMGGAEKSLVNLLNELSPDDMDLDLLLIKRQGVLMKQVPDWVNIIDAPYELSCLFGGRVRSLKGLAFLLLFGTISLLSGIMFPFPPPDD